MEKKITFKTDKSGITIRIPRTLLTFVAKNHPDGLIVTEPYNLHERVAEELEHNTDFNHDSGLTGFQQLIDNAIAELAQNDDCVSLKDLD